MREQGEVWIDIGSDQGFEAVNLRIMHMLSDLGCNPFQRGYFGPRFFYVTRFIGSHGDEMCVNGLTTVDDGEVAVVTDAGQKAVLEAFEPDPMPAYANIDAKSVFSRGKELLVSGFTEDLPASHAESPPITE